MKTFNAGLFICLNLGVDPPDIVKTNPCAKLECWLDPTALPASKAIEAIGRSKPAHRCHPGVQVADYRSVTAIRDAESESQV